jgi:hypothetical protein
VRLCVYAVTAPGAGRVGVRGIAGERLRQVVIGTVAAIVGELPRAPSPSPTILRRYDEVIRSLSTRRNAALPARFGSCFGTLEELTATFRVRERILARTLRHVRGRLQMTIRVLPRSGLQATGSGTLDYAARPNIRPRPTSGAAGRLAPGATNLPGFTYLRGRAAALASERAIRGFDPVRDAVRRWVRDEQVEKRGAVASVYHLVPRASADAYRRAAYRAAVSAGLDIVVTGPHPPYAFA